MVPVRAPVFDVRGVLKNQFGPEIAVAENPAPDIGTEYLAGLGIAIVNPYLARSGIEVLKMKPDSSCASRTDSRGPPPSAVTRRLPRAKGGSAQLPVPPYFGQAVRTARRDLARSQRLQSGNRDISEIRAGELSGGRFRRGNPASDCRHGFLREDRKFDEEAEG